jgi:lipoprotein signal peptidase
LTVADSGDATADPSDADMHALKSHPGGGMHVQVEVADRSGTSFRSRPVGDSERRAAGRLFVLVAVAAIIVIDQAVKWWSWRHVPDVRINYGGDGLVPPTVGSWYARPAPGALLDLLDSGLLIGAASLFLRRRRPALMLISGSLIIGGWSSNLLDRLATHYWTAPGGVRGVVDFIPFNRHYYNVADLFIVIGTPLFVLAIVGHVLRRLVTTRPTVTAQMKLRARSAGRARRVICAVAAVVVLTAVVGVGAANFGGANAPDISASQISVTR